MQWSAPAGKGPRENGATGTREAGSRAGPRPGRPTAASGAPTHRVAAPAWLAAALAHPRVAAVVARLARLPRGVLAAAALAALVMALVVSSLLPGPPPPARGPVADVGTMDFSFAANGVKAPTGRKPEAAKLWFNDGAWWGALFVPARDAYTINRFDMERRRWIDTGVVIDDRNVSRADVLWSGDHLYAVSAGTDPRSEKQGAILVRFSYDRGSRSYAADDGFPVRLTDTGAETLVLDRDDTGRLWVTYTRDRAVQVTHSLATDRDWVVPYVLPVPQAMDLTADDISAVVAYDDAVGIMWSDQSEGAMYFASRPTGVSDDAPWSVTAAIQGPGLADDHMNLKALRDDPAGLVMAVVKTSRNDAPNAAATDPLIVLLVLGRDGTWQQHAVGTVRDDATRPLLLVDEDHRELYVFTSGPCCSGGTIYVKQSSLDDIAFPEGTGTPFIRRGSPGSLNNPTSTKQNVGRESGLLVLASDDQVDMYAHNVVRLDGPLVPQPSVAPGSAPPASGTGAPPSGGAVRVLLVDGFEEAGLAEWELDVGPGSRIVEQAGTTRTDRGALRLAAGLDPRSHAAARFALPEPGADLGVGFDVFVVREGAEDGNVPLLRLFDAAGERILSVYRQNERSGRIWVGLGDDRVPTTARLALDTWGRLDVALRTTAGARLVAVRLDGRLVAEVPLDVAAPIAVVQLGNDSDGQAFELVVDNVRVTR